MAEVLKGMTEGISPRQFHEADGVDEWRVLGEGACTYFRTRSFAAGAPLVHAISETPSLDSSRSTDNCVADPGSVRPPADVS